MNFSFELASCKTIKKTILGARHGLTKLALQRSPTVCWLRLSDREIASHKSLNGDYIWPKELFEKSSLLMAFIYHFDQIPLPF